MNKPWKTICLVALLAVNGAAAAAGHNKGHGNGNSHAVTPPPPSSNRQALPDADRGLERSQEREAERAIERSRAGEQQTEHAPNLGLEHRNEGSLDSQGKGWKNPAE
ncbi:hypothetical protein [Immundisolibacter sp.]|uniref:hypothetical protein n=1 Tax=Immundisolibacter sp. TaxID=1934948 RepID=UPI002603F09E|nr:hypothetical protein [Immundisolibacter sp.]MDD3651448.1 hypothetical protein [Immundisolibacter sp.]